jgi:hypothetical protein
MFGAERSAAAASIITLLKKWKSVEKEKNIGQNVGCKKRRRRAYRKISKKTEE